MFDNDKPGVLQHVRQFGFVGGFLMIRLRLFIFCENITEQSSVLTASSQGEHDFALFFYW